MESHLEISYNKYHYSKDLKCVIIFLQVHILDSRKQSLIGQADMTV